MQTSSNIQCTAHLSWHYRRSQWLQAILTSFLNVAGYSGKVMKNTILRRYDLGVTGGVVSMPQFLDKFFPEVRYMTAVV